MSKNWNEENTAILASMIQGVEQPIPHAKIAEIAQALGLNTRSVAAKLRNQKIEVAKAEKPTSKWSEGNTEKLRAHLTNFAGKHTADEIAEKLFKGEFNGREVRGKALSLELSGNFKKAEPKPKVFSEQESAQIVKMAREGSSIEEIAEGVGKSIAAVRAKCITLMKQVEGFSMPYTANKKEQVKEDPLAGLDISELTVEQISKAVGRTERGIKVMLTRRALTCSDYDGAKRAAKNAAKKEAA